MRHLILVKDNYNQVAKFVYDDHYKVGRYCSGYKSYNEIFNIKLDTTREMFEDITCYIKMVIKQNGYKCDPKDAIILSDFTKVNYPEYLV